MYGSEWSKEEDRSGLFYVFDCRESNGSGFDNLEYWVRHEHIRQLKGLDTYPSNWRLVANYTTLQLDSIWNNLVANCKFEGLVFRSPSDTWHSEILRAKLTLTVDLRIVDYERGNGRLSNSLGALVAVDGAGRTHTIGGGLSDALRKEIWAEPEKFRGRWFVCGCKKIFKTGQLRHPNFTGWHPDKE